MSDSKQVVDPVYVEIEPCDKLEEIIRPDKLVEKALFETKRIYNEHVQKLTVEYVEQLFMDEMVGSPDSPYSQYVVLITVPSGARDYYYTKFFINDDIPTKMKNTILASSSGKEWHFVFIDGEIRLYLKRSFVSIVFCHNQAWKAWKAWIVIGVFIIALLVFGIYAIVKLH